MLRTVGTKLCELRALSAMRSADNASTGAGIQARFCHLADCHLCWAKSASNSTNIHNSINYIEERLPFSFSPILSYPPSTRVMCISSPSQIVQPSEVLLAAATVRQVSPTGSDLQDEEQWQERAERTFRRCLLRRGTLEGPDRAIHGEATTGDQERVCSQNCEGRGRRRSQQVSVSLYSAPSPLRDSPDPRSRDFFPLPHSRTTASLVTSCRQPIRPDPPCIRFLLLPLFCRIRIGRAPRLLLQSSPHTQYRQVCLKE